MSTLSHSFRVGRALGRALGTLVLAALLLAGPPLALVRFVGNPLPQSALSWEEVSFALTSGQIDPWVWIRGLAVVAWVAWAHLALSFTIELVAIFRGAKARAVRGLGATQWLASRLVAQLSLAASLALQSGAATASMALAPLPVATVLEQPVVDAPAPAPDLGADGPAALDATPGASVEERASAIAPAEEQVTVTVARGDTLWSLAEQHLADGERWEVIRDANVGRRMADGTLLGPDFTRVERGWTLRLPGIAGPAAPEGASDPAAVPERGHPVADDGDEPAAAGDALQSVGVEVARGDSLWRLSEHQLRAVGPEPGDAEVLAYVNEVVERNGDAIDDPDLIYPGQVFQFPDTAKGERTSALDHGRDQPATGQGPVTPTNPPQHQSQPSLVEAPSQPTIDHQSDDLLPEPYHTLVAASLGSGSTLLAVGALNLVRRRRRYRMAHRSPGTVPAPAPAELDPVARALQRFGDEEAVAWLGLALGSLGARPVWEGEQVAQPVLVTLDETQVEVEFDAADTMAGPLPWDTPDDGLRWELARGLTEAELPTGLGRDLMPTLVTVGAGVLINLEGAGVVALTGEGLGPHNLVRSLVHELATSRSAGTIDVRTTFPVAGTESYDLVQVQDGSSMVTELVPWLDDMAERLDEAQATNAYAYRLAQDEEPLGPVVIVTDSAGLASLGPLPDYARLRNLPLAMVIVGLAPAEVVIEMGPDGSILRPWGRDLAAQELSEDVAAALGALLADAGRDAEVPLVAGLELSASVADLRTRLDHPLPTAAPQPVSEAERTAPVPAGGPAPITEAGPADPDWPDVDSPQTGVADPGDPDSDPDPELVGDVAPAITIRVLGDVFIEDGPDLTSQQLSMLTFIACHGSTTRSALIDGLWDGQAISQSRFPNLLAEVRAKIGRNHLPEARDGRYELRRVTTDLALFEEGVRLAARQDNPEAAITLRSILELVRGMPLTPPGRRFWSWVGDESHMATRIEAMVADTAARLASVERSLGNVDGAIWACEQGLKASPTDETLVIALTEAYLAQGKSGLASRLVTSWEDKISRMDCGEPSDEPRKRLAS